MEVILIPILDVKEIEGKIQPIVVLKYFIYVECKEDKKYINEIKQEMDLNLKLQFHTKEKLY